MTYYQIEVCDPTSPTPKTEQLTWRLAAMATGVYGESQAVTDMVVNRIIDNAACAMAAINRLPVASARAQAIAHLREGGAPVLGLPSDLRAECGWAAWANCAAVRELDFHDTFMAAEVAHPGDNIPGILAVAQQCGRTGADTVKGIATGYQVQISLSEHMGLNPHGIDHVAHLGPSIAAGICAALGVSTEVAYQAINHALHVSTATRQGRKGNISSWKAFAPGHVAKCAIEAVDRAMRGETSPAPVYEGDYGIIATLLGGPDASYGVNLPGDGEPRDGILSSYTKEHSAGYHGQAIIDLAFKMRDRVPDVSLIERVDLHTKRYSHVVMGTGSGDPHKYDPGTSRETLDHSAVYMFAVALQDGEWHHERSYAPERRSRPDTVELWRRVFTVEDEDYNRRYYDEPDPLKKDLGARAEITLNSGDKIIDELSHANAHPSGARPFGRAEYIDKLKTLTDGICSAQEVDNFVSTVEALDQLAPADLARLNIAADMVDVKNTTRDAVGIF